MFLQVSDSHFYNGPRQEALENLTWQKDLECHLVLCQKLLTEFCCLIPILPAQNGSSVMLFAQSHTTGKQTLNQLCLRPKAEFSDPSALSKYPSRRADAGWEGWVSFPSAV